MVRGHAVFPKDPIFSVIRDLSLCRVAPLKSLPAHLFSVVMFTFSGLLGLLYIESRVALNPGLGGMGDVASAIISHEQIQ